MHDKEIELCYEMSSGGEKIICLNFAIVQLPHLLGNIYIHVFIYQIVLVAMVFIPKMNTVF